MPIIYSRVISEPGTEPISLTEAKSHLRVDHSNEDDLIDILRQAAREMVENHTNRSLITQTREITIDYFPLHLTNGWGCVPLTHGPVSSVTSVEYYDGDDVEQTLNSSLYWVDTNSGIPKIVVKNSWPSTYDKPNAITITYVAGYGAASDVPSPLRQAMLLILGHLYENRQQVIVSGSPTAALEIPFGASALMSTYVLEQSVVY